MKFIVKDRMSKVADKVYCTAYHAEQIAKALNLNDGTHYLMYYGSARFTVVRP